MHGGLAFCLSPQAESYKYSSRFAPCEEIGAGFCAISKSCTYYTYDAAGSTLSKTVNDYKTNTVKKYTYVGGFVYLSNYAIGATAAPDTLQYAMFEEGRMRWKTVSGQPLVVFDYMLKDHAGNVRTVITDEVRRDDYPMATMETAQTTNEELIYAGLPETRTNKNTIPSYPTDNTTSPNDFVAKVQATAGSQKVGPSLTLKVMTGDTINIRVNSWYKLNGATPSAPQSPLTNIVTSLISGISGSAVVNTHGVTSNQFNTANTFTPDVTSFLNNQTNNTTGSKPKAFINWIFFDEQFNIVQSASGFEQVGDDSELKLHVKQPVATKCGFLYVYVSNETPNIPVYFDNLQVSHIRSPLLETNEYYPYGLKMASISYKASMTITNRYGWNGGNEYEDEGDLNYSNTFYRKYDAQIGRFTGVDMLAEEFAFINPYQFGYNNPVMFNDPMGDQNKQGFGRMQKGPDNEYHPGWYSEKLWNDVGFFDWQNQGESSGLYYNIQGFSSIAIANKLSFGEMISQNKRGEWGVYIPAHSKESNIKGDGHMNLDGVTMVSGQWLSFGNFTLQGAEWETLSWSGIGRNVDPSSFKFRKMTTNAWEAGVSGLYFDITYMKKSPPWKKDYHFKLQTTFVQFPKKTGSGKDYKPNEMANITAVGFQHAITYLSMTLATLWKENEVANLSERDFQKMFYESAAFYISQLADGQAIVKNVSNNGTSTIITPVVWTP